MYKPEFGKPGRRVVDATTLLEDTIDGTVSRLALSMREAAEALGISDRTLWSWTKDGIIPAVRIGGRWLYPVDVIREWLKERAAENKSVDT